MNDFDKQIIGKDEIDPDPSEMTGECKECDKWTDFFCMYGNFECNIWGSISTFFVFLFIFVAILICVKYRVVCRVVKWLWEGQKEESELEI